MGGWRDTLDAQAACALQRVPRNFYRRRAVDLAPHLLGLILVHDTPEGVTAGRMIEVEAYEGPEDRACHAFGGRRTPRTEVMFGPPAFAYVYFTYGMHWMFNVVSAPEEVPHAVLVRSIEPVCGTDLMAKRRSGMLPLAEGPARMARAMGITGRENGMDLVASDLYIAFPPPGMDSPVEYLVTKRIGVEQSGKAKDYPWRFVRKGSPPAAITSATREKDPARAKARG